MIKSFNHSITTSGLYDGVSVRVLPFSQQYLHFYVYHIPVALPIIRSFTRTLILKWGKANVSIVSVNLGGVTNDYQDPDAIYGTAQVSLSIYNAFVDCNKSVRVASILTIKNF